MAKRLSRPVLVPTIRTRDVLLGSKIHPFDHQASSTSARIMADEPKFYFLKPPGLPISEKENLLARIVKSHANPIADYTPNGSPGNLIQFPAPPLSSGVTNVQVVLSSSSQTTAKALMTTLAAFTKEDSHEADISFASEAVEVVRLQQHSDTFDRLKTIPEVQQKLAKMVRVGGKAYLVVGLLIWKNTRFSSGHTSSDTISATAALPLESIVTAATGGIPVPLGKAEVTVQDANATRNALKASVKEEQIIGLEYRLIKRELLGLGSGLKVSTSAVRYEGGKYYSKGGEDEGEDISEEDDDGQGSILQGVVLTDSRVEGCAA